MRTPLAAVLLAAALAGCAAPRALAPAAPVKDRDLGISKTSVFDVPSPPAFKAEDSTPGGKPLPPRLGLQIPPVIPHGVADLLPIKRDQNACLDCHQIPGPKKAGEPTPLPASHYLDYRNGGKQAGDKVAGARFICTACHVSRTDAPVAVGSAFRP
jgi:nitrate reductase (cytochrome), electron transfer subunit